MNIAQEIINLILKMMYYEDFKNSFTEKEKKFIDEIRESSLRYFRISSLHQRRTIFTWESSIGDSVACYVGDDGFHFSQTVAYKTSTKRMKDYDYEKLPPEEQAILDQELENLKRTFRTYFPDVDVYFK